MKALSLLLALTTISSIGFSATAQPSSACLRRVKNYSTVIQNMANTNISYFNDSVTSGDDITSSDKQVAADADLLIDAVQNVRHGVSLSARQSSLVKAVCVLRVFDDSTVGDAIASVSQK
jgi:hypothetical protein